MKHFAPNLFALLTVCLSLLLLGGVCEMSPTSDPIDLKEIPGIYEANYNAGLVDKIELRADSVYIRYFVSKDGHKFIDSGRYWFYYRDNDSTDVAITLLDFINRFTVNPRNSYEYYSTANDAIYDSVPRHLSTIFFKEHGELQIIRKRYGQEYIKRLK
jgi:hypothetical protein